MKNQYFGDINDFVKYGLLRALACDDLRTVMAWMLTAPDGRTDGRHTGYLARPERFRDLDPELFDGLAKAIAAKRRSVVVAEELGLLPNARYHRTLLGDDLPSRVAYFDKLLWESRACDVVFFDPDNGLEVPSTPMGRRGSSKYLYWAELEKTLQSGTTIVVYQHFPRVARDTYVAGVRAEIRRRLRSDSLVLRTPRVAFLVIPNKLHDATVRDRARATALRWASLISIDE